MERSVASVRFKIPLLLNNIMEAIMITSENNVKLKEMIKLQKNARHRKKEGLFVAEGIKLVQEAAQYGKLRQYHIGDPACIDFPDQFRMI